MKQRWFLVAFGLACLAVGQTSWSESVRAAEAPVVQWIWFDEGDPARDAPAETRYFRRTFNLPEPPDEAALDITADNQFVVWLNGVAIGRGDDWMRVSSFDAKKHLRKGRNVLAVQAHNTGGPAGLLVRLTYIPNGHAKAVLVSDKTWKASRTAADGWQKPEFNDSKWIAAKEIGPYGEAGPWRGLAWGGTGRSERFTVPPGFVVEMAVQNPDPADAFSLVNMTFDSKGRLLVSRENGPVMLCTEPNKTGVLERVKPYCTQVQNCQGMCWVKDALYLVGEGPQGTGLYRVRDTKGLDKTDEVKLIHRYAGGMGEHGPHAVLHGPDGWLYLVIGNHAWAKPDKLADNSPLRRWPHGQMGPDQGKPGTTEDVLLPRLNDANGHAANILAPGGTIWRLDHDGKHMSLVAAGFRNQFDATFSPEGELFTFDSDMEWDEGLPWYRPVRICHCSPGADFVWRTGAANTPDYYVDSLPSVYDTGRGSPVGLEFYDHYAFPDKYRGAFFMADWSLGLIYAVFLERDGATYKAKKIEKFCTGNPMNITDLAVAPDGSLYFTMGGRGSQGGVSRIVYRGTDDKPPVKKTPAGPFKQPQPFAAWSRAVYAREIGKDYKRDNEFFAELAPTVARDRQAPIRARLQALDALHNYVEGHPKVDLLTDLVQEPEAEIRAHGVWLLGVKGYKEGRDLLVRALKDNDALVRRRACEALIRAGFEPPVEALWPLLGDGDRFLRTAARLVLQRIDPQKWTDRLWKEENNRIAFEGIIALCKINKAAPHAEAIFKRLSDLPAQPGLPLADYVRTVQLALVHTNKPKATLLQPIARRCLAQFPHKDWRVNRELAIVLTHFRREGVIDDPVHARLLGALLQDKNDRAQQIHYFYCLRLLHDGWTPEQKRALLAWYDGTKTWQGGASFAGFLENILRDLASVFTADDRNQILARAEELPWAATALLRIASDRDAPAPAVLADLYGRLARAKPGAIPRAAELREAVILALSRCSGAEAQAALRKIAESDSAQRDVIARAVARAPSADNWPLLVRGLESTNPVLLQEILDALKRVPTKPNDKDPAPYRAVLLASNHLPGPSRWKAVELLRHWSNDRQFGAAKGEWQPELQAWARWFGQTFDKEPPLPGVGTDPVAASKHKLETLLAYLDKGAGRKGNAAAGRKVFEKAQCLKCHKFGKEGEAIGPDLTAVSKRFNRKDILESILDPSKVISDQYRSSVIVTKEDRVITGLAAPQGDRVTLLQSDGSKVTLRKDQIQQQYASLVSVMPEKLLDPLELEEIADLFALLESEPPK
jgi:putative heme-binding domain-containing protein